MNQYNKNINGAKIYDEILLAHKEFERVAANDPDYQHRTFTINFKPEVNRNKTVGKLKIQIAQILRREFGKYTDDFLFYFVIEGGRRNPHIHGEVCFNGDIEDLKQSITKHRSTASQRTFHSHDYAPDEGWGSYCLKELRSPYNAKQKVFVSKPLRKVIDATYREKYEAATLQEYLRESYELIATRQNEKAGDLCFKTDQPGRLDIKTKNTPKASGYHGLQLMQIE